MRAEQFMSSWGSFTTDLRRYSIPDSQIASTMDCKSHSVPLPTPRPTSSVYSNDISIMTNLIRDVSEEIRVQEHQTIAAFMREIQALEEELALRQRAWNGTIMLANQVIEASTNIEKSLITVDANVASAEKEWLAFWGIYKESIGSHPLWL